MLYEFNKKTLYMKIDGLSLLHKIAFGASCCERLLPNYKLFVDNEGWGDFSYLENTLDKLWSYVSGRQITLNEVEILSKKCYELTPDSEDFGSVLVSYAIDAGVAVFETLLCCLDNEAQHLVDIASVSRDAVDLFIQERDHMNYSDLDFEEKILADSLMQKELYKQLNDLELLKNNQQLDSQFLTKFRATARGDN